MIKIYSKIKKKIRVVLAVFVFLVSANVYALGDIGYYKYKNKIIISIDELFEESAVLIVGKYYSDGERFFESDAIEIKKHDGSYESRIIYLSEGFKYKFFVWDNIENLRPLCNALLVTYDMPDGSNSSSDSEYTEFY